MHDPTTKSHSETVRLLALAKSTRATTAKNQTDWKELIALFDALPDLQFPADGYNNSDGWFSAHRYRSRRADTAL